MAHKRSRRRRLSRDELEACVILLAAAGILLSLVTLAPAPSAIQTAAAAVALAIAELTRQLISGGRGGRR